MKAKPYGTQSCHQEAFGAHGSLIDSGPLPACKERIFHLANMGHIILHHSKRSVQEMADKRVEGQLESADCCWRNMPVLGVDHDPIDCVMMSQLWRGAAKAGLTHSWTEHARHSGPEAAHFEPLVVGSN